MLTCFLIATLHQALDNNTKALDYHNKAIAINNTLALYHNNRATVLSQLQQKDEAIKAQESAISLEPQNTLYRQNLQKL